MELINACCKDDLGFGGGSQFEIHDINDVVSEQLGFIGVRFINWRDEH